MSRTTCPELLRVDPSRSTDAGAWLALGLTVFLLGTGPREDNAQVFRQKIVSRLAVVAGALAIGLLAPLPLTAGPLAPTCAQAATGPSVAIVVDFGTVSGHGNPPGGVLTRCVPATSGLTGAQALKNAGFTLRFQGGLLCGINGYPASGCGEKTGARKYMYWAYWRADGGTNGWEYSSIGPAGARMADGDVDGWRFVEGSGSPNDPQPGAPPDHLAICGPLEPDRPSNPSANAPSAPAPATPSDATGPSGDGGGGSGARSTDTTGAATTGANSADAPAEVAVEPDGTARTATSAGDVGDEFALDDATPATETSSAGGTIGIVVVVVLIGALASAAIVRSKRQPRAQ